MTLTLGWGNDWNVPFNEGFIGGNSDDVPYPFEVSIDGQPFTIDLAQYAWGISAMIRSSVDQGARPGEQSLDIGGVWKRVVGDLSLGAGQLYPDATKASDRRFNSSLGVNVWTERQITLLPDTEVVSGSVPSAHSKLLPVGSFMYEARGSSLQRATDWQSTLTTATLTAITGITAGTIADITTDGDAVYIAGPDAIYKAPTTGTVATAMGNGAASLVADRLEYANGFLVAGVGSALYLVSADGVLTLLKQHHAASFRWALIVGAPNAVYAGGQSGDAAEIYRFDFDQNTGGFLPGVSAAVVERGEFVRCGAYYGGALFIGTNLGFHLANVGNAGDLQTGPLIATPHSVDSVYGDGEYVYFSYTNADATHTGVARAHLADFSSDLVPGWATDIMALNTQGAVSSVTRFQGMTFFSVASGSVWRPSHLGNLVPSGTIDLGRFEFGSFEPKTFVGLEIITQKLHGKVTPTLTDDEEVEYVLETLDNTEVTNRGRLLGRSRQIQATFIGVAMLLERSGADSTLGPTVRSLTLRAIPVPLQVEKFTIPIICKSMVRIGDRSEQDEPQNVLEIRKFFVQLRRSGAPVVYQEGASKYIVVVREIEQPAHATTAWAEGRSGLQGILLVTLHNVGG